MVLEVWKQINGYENYLISNFGNVYSLKSDKYLKQHLNGRGYMFVNLYKDKKFKDYCIHRILAEHFIDNPFNLPFVDHKDCNKTNNQLNNLRWVFPFDNSHNIIKCNRNNKLGIRNISFEKNRNKYVYIKCIRGKRHLKRFNTLEEAVKYKSLIN